MLIKKYRIDFYQLQFLKKGKKGKTFGSILDSLYKTPCDGSRYLTDTNNPVGVLELHCPTGRSEVYEGNLVKLRMDEGAMKGNLTDATLMEIALSNDEALAESSAFLYHPPTNVLALQRNRYGVTSSLFAWYFAEKAGVGAIQLLPCIREEAIDRLAEVRTSRKLRIALAGVTDEAAARLRKQGRTPEQILDFMLGLGAPNADITVSMGRKKEHLKQNRVVAACRQFYAALKDEGATVKKLQITGRNAADQITVLDLLEDWLHQEDTITSTRRIIEYARRRMMVKEAWQKHRDELTRLYAQDQE